MRFVTIVIPSIIEYSDVANERVCNFNRLQLEKTYEIYLELESIDHSENIFTTFLKENVEVCPSNDIITCKDRKIKCGKHNDVEEKDDVPYL